MKQVSAWRGVNIYGMGWQPPRALVAVLIVLVMAGAGATALVRRSDAIAPDAGASVVTGETSALGPSPRHLRIVGDSMSALAAAELREAGQAAGYEVDVLAISGITLEQMLGVVAAAARYGDGPLVVELGTNDVAQRASSAELEARIESAVADAGATPCALFVDVGLLSGAVDVADRFNADLEQALAAHPNLHLYQWGADYRAHADWTFDDVHLQRPFYGAYAGNIVAAADRACRSVPFSAASRV